MEPQLVQLLQRGVLQQRNQFADAHDGRVGMIRTSGAIFSAGITLLLALLCATIPASDEEAIDRLPRRIWKEYRDCLKRGDIEKALTYIHPHNRDRYREIFKYA